MAHISCGILYTLHGFVIACVAVGALSLSGAILVTRIGHRLRLTDIPNDRSSHVIPKPRGGGVGIVIAFSIVLFGFATFAHGDVNYWALGAGALTVASVGLLDDVTSVTAQCRLLIHLAASLLVVYTAKAGWTIPLAGHWHLAGIGGAIIAALAIAWMINLFNFMDGIDGIAGTEAVFVTGAASLLLYQADAGNLFSPVLALLAAASIGFLAVNWPPSRVFMGDVGSGFLGYSIGAFAFCTSASHLVSIWTWLILTAAFSVDATVTLVRRGLHGNSLHTAHRMHAYQHLSRRWASHRRVTLLVIVVDMCWLLPMAFASVQWAAWAPGVFLVAATPIALAVWRLRAGLPD
jgi:Fuc2NAc and GlcNAc transferase